MSIEYRRETARGEVFTGFSPLLYFVRKRYIVWRRSMVREQTKPRTIVRNPRILFGEPIIEGTRIPVRAVVLYKYEYGDVEGVLTALPTLRAEDVEIAMRYYADHREEINRHIAENNEGEDIPYDEL